MWSIEKLGDYRFNANLPEKDVKKFKDIYVTTKDQIPNEGGILLPFVSELAREDDNIVPRVIERYFFNLLGDTKQECIDTFDLVKASWGNIKMTSWGDELAHMFACIDVSFQAGTYIKLLVSPKSGYNGCVLLGGGFTLARGDEEWEPVTFEKLQESYNLASPHGAAFDKIWSLISFPDDFDSDAAKLDVLSTAQLAAIVRKYGYQSMAVKEIKSAARNLDFAADQYFSVSAVNIVRVLQAIHDKDMDETTFPLHRLAFLEADRTNRLLSAFGAYSFSFQVAAGRKMSLRDDKFVFKMRGTGKKMIEIETHRMFVEIVPWEKACESFKVTLTDASVKSPIGTELMSRMSTKSTVKEFNGDAGKAVLEALQFLTKGESTIGLGKGKKRALGDGKEDGADKNERKVKRKKFEVESDDEDKPMSDAEE